MFSVRMIYKVWCIIVIITINILAQDPILEGLDNPDPHIRINTLYLIQNNNLIEYTSAIEERMFAQSEPYIIYEYMRTLYVLESENLESYALEFIEFADNFPNMEPSDDPLRAKVYATHILFTLNNYSTSDYAFEIINRDFPKVNSDAQDIMVLALRNVPELREQARIELLRMIDNCPDNFVRFYSLDVLKDYYEHDFINYFLDWFENDTYAPIRMRCLAYLSELHYSQLDPLLKSRLSQDPDWSLRIMIADSLLLNFGEPSDFKAVIDYHPNEPDETASSLMAYSIDEFIPLKPDTLNWSGLITKLISYISEMYSYQWIANTLTRDYYISKLNLLNSQITLGRYKDACNTLNKDLLARIEKDLISNYITTEGYKFLHYYCVYIKEEFPGPLACP